MYYAPDLAARMGLSLQVSGPGRVRAPLGLSVSPFVEPTVTARANAVEGEPPRAAAAASCVDLSGRKSTGAALGSWGIRSIRHARPPKAAVSAAVRRAIGGRRL